MNTSIPTVSSHVPLAAGLYRPTLAAVASSILVLAGCGGGDATNQAAASQVTASAVDGERERSMAAADPSAPSAVGKFSIGHTSGVIESSNTPISLAFLNDHKAGSRGQVKNVGGKLYAGSERLRVYGIVLYSGSAMPSKSDAILLAQRLKKEGFNGVRFFGIDKELAKDNTWSVTHLDQGIFNNDQTLNSGAMDLLDHMVYQLQEAGIYVQIPLKSSRVYLDSLDCIDICEGIDNFVPALITAQKKHASAFLNHYNPYTKRYYKDDPGILAFEINNENSMSHRWSKGSFDTYTTDPVLYSKYGSVLEARWRSWAQAKYSSASAAALAWGTPTVALTDLKIPLKANQATMSAKYFSDFAQFLGDAENAYMKDMYSYVKNTVGTSALVLGTQAHYTPMYAREGTDITDFHSYHGPKPTPTGIVNPTNGRPVFTVPNKSVLMYSEPKESGLFGVHERKSLDKPNMISEFVYRYGNQYIAESEPLISAYAGFQDIDALFMTNAHNMNLNTNKDFYSGWYNNTISTVSRVGAALAFRRGDMTPGAPHVVKQTKQSYIDLAGTWKNWSLINFHFGGNVRAAAALNIYQQVVNSTAEEAVVKFTPPADGVYVTSTGQMSWKPMDRIMVNSPMSKAAIGLFSNTPLDLGSGIKVNVGTTMNKYAVVQMSSLTKGASLPSNKMLLTLTGHWNVPGEYKYPRAPGSGTFSWGTDFPRIESITSTVRITTPLNLVVSALDPTGARKASVPVVRNGADIEFVTGPAYDTGWYLIEDASSTSPPTNSSPTATLSASSTATVGIATTLTASASDSDGSVSKVEFYDGSTLLATDTSSPYSASWMPATAGSRTLTVRVTDNSGATATSAPVVVTVASSSTNALPNALLSAPATATVGTATPLSATASDPDGTIGKVEFFDGTTLIGSDTTSPYAVSWVPSTSGTRSLTVRATDNAGGTKTSNTVNVVVSAGTNALPTVSLSAANAATVGVSTTLAATASDTDGTISKVEFYDGANIVGTDTSAPFSLAWKPATSGSRSLTARATDSSGGIKTSAPVTVTVAAPANVAPTVVLSAATSATVGVAFSINATATDSDGSVVKVEFFNGSTLIGTDTTSPFGISVVPSAVGTYSLTARATDNVGTTKTSSALSVQVAAAPVAGTGLLAQYYNNASLSGNPSVTRVEDASHVWGTAAPAVGIPADYWSARWMGSVIVPQTGTYSFQITADDGIRARVNGNLVLNNWDPSTGSGNNTYTVATLSLKAGDRIPVTIEHFDLTAGSTMMLRWKTPSSGTYWTDIPMAQLTTETATSVSTSTESTGSSGLLATYFKNTSLSGSPAVTRTEAPSFTWASGSPAPGVIPADGWSARWTGYAVIPATGTYTFQITGDDGVRSTINGAVVANDWTSSGNVKFQSAPMTLAAGTRVPVSIEHFDGTGDSTLMLRWMTPSSNGYWQDVPVTQLKAN